MAGESPDRSKQRESSAQPTSGSAGPVPEARSEAADTREPRDPRLAVARDTEKSSTRGGVDTATRVLSARTAEDPTSEKRPSDAERDSEAAGADAERDSEAAAGDAERGESGSGAEGAAAAGQGAAEAAAEGSGGASGSGEPGGDAAAGDGRLRDAVAAWVASADEDEEPAAAKGADKDAEGDQRAADGAEEPRKADTGAQEAEEPTGTPEADRDAQDGPEAERADEPTDAQDAGKPSGTPEADTDAEDRPEAERAGEPTEADSDRQGEEGPDGAPEAEADRSGTGGGAVDGSGNEAGPAASEADAQVKADRQSGKAAEPVDPRVSDDADAEPETDADDTPADADKGSKTEPAADADDAPGAGGSGKDAKSDEADGDSPATPPVDQPTAVFKAVRPPVDQPTTMLKLGGAAKGAPETPERESERTSKFVALKPLDDPSARKPAAPADATAPVPTVGPERTTQQPLPPKPPLDLLAELTNTPPPPDTPLRTAVRRVKIWTPLVLLLVVVFAVVQSVRPLPAPTLELTAEDSYTFEGGKVDIPWPTDGQAALDVQGIGSFGSSGEQKPVPIASVAKVMTAYVILRDHPLKSGDEGPKIEIDQAAEDQSDAGQESTVDVTKGDKITEREALESILIASANNIARLLARWDAGSEKAFVQKMNDAAKDLGMKNTTYTDPSGLNNTTVSTAVDQVKLAKAAMEQPAFREVAAMMSYVDYKGVRHDNWNRLVGSNDVTGIKTGTTTSALGNLVFSARKDVDGETRRIVGAVVRQPAGGPDNTILGAALHEGDKLIRAAQGALESATILKKGDIVGYADDGLGGRTPVAVTEDVTAVGWAGLSVKLTFAPDDLPHTAKAGTKVGTLTVGDGTTSAVKVPVALQEDLVEPGFADKLTRLG
ncbi:D-alanyl-D-alanine carboxypeptidase [Streptomyces lomondensis]|uniref:serine-type D-Ala-D-Ala carboxypeptidase n=1 Tax=Streptomyces lomondensis TaxID=68229 RepID=A0ABQ2XTF9_9ACTN|nr:D-alanyl-D-alanine carboxypeptidase [Streptomyces lomondensis]MCF0082476.1 D-alanyl-D-alanine carboxypeptidase [Streptomyces lomondensis]GGX33447.1 D-alanyl-D-alanine carboxypeptidase [Streptomyces lomondensis]